MLFKVLVSFALLSVALSHQAEKKEHKPQPYHFGYKTKSEHGTQFRNEKSDGKGRVHGSYGYTDATGNYREVTYVADHNGFRAEIRTNEHGTSDADPANVAIKSAARREFGDIKKFVAKLKSPKLASPETKKAPRQKPAKYSDVRFFHFHHSHEEKRGEDEDEDDSSSSSEDREKSDEVETKTSGEQEGGDEGESEAEERRFFHRVGKHGGHE